MKRWSVAEVRVGDDDDLGNRASPELRDLPAP
jgi:hypothetical protein